MPVYATGGGSISYAGRLAGRGVVTVTHGALRTTYEPVRVVVHVGDEVVAGEKIGALESFGSHCAPTSCLHWGLLRGERYLDPLAPLRRGPSRLLPVWGRPEPVFNDTVSGPAAPRDPGSRQPGSSPVDVAPSEGARDAPGRAAATTFAGAATAGAFLVYRGRRR